MKQETWVAFSMSMNLSSEEMRSDCKLRSNAKITKAQIDTEQQCLCLLQYFHQIQSNWQNSILKLKNVA